MYSIQALWSAAQLELPIAFIILNNRRYAALQDFAPVFGFARAKPSWEPSCRRSILSRSPRAWGAPRRASTNRDDCASRSATRFARRFRRCLKFSSSKFVIPAKAVSSRGDKTRRRGKEAASSVKSLKHPGHQADQDQVRVGAPAPACMAAPRPDGWIPAFAGMTRKGLLRRQLDGRADRKRARAPCLSSALRPA